jgi:hypothetical protein
VTLTLRDLTLLELKRAGVKPSLEQDGTLRVAALDSNVGDIVVSFEGDEISVFLGDITHCHFIPYAAQDNFPGCTPGEAAADASQFIHEVVSDQWVIWRWRDGRGGCFKLGCNDEESADAPLPGEEVESLVWSGRLVPPNTSFERTREG